MQERITISSLTKLTGVSSKTLRYWESRGLLPRAARSHTGYRLFDLECAERVEFIQKAKSIGLTLGEIANVLALARSGVNPCPEIVQWSERKVKILQQQVELLSSLRRRLDQFRRKWSKKLPCPPVRISEICCLIEDLPSPKSLKGGVRDAKAMVARTGRRGGARC